MKWQGLIDAEKTKVGTLGLETADAASTVITATNAPVDVENMDGSVPTEADLKQLLKEYVEQTDAQIAEISALKEENARLREARAEPEASSDVVDLGADEESRSLAAAASSMDKQTLVAMAKQKIDAEETANLKLKEAMAAMEETHHEERTVYDRRVADVRAAKRDAEAKRADAVAATSELQKALDAEKARAEKAQADAEAALEHDERRVANLHAKLREAAKLEKEMEEKKNVAADAARRLRQKLAEADRAEAASGTEAEPAESAEKKPIAKVGAAEEGVAALALPPRRRPPTGAESQ
jgi:colicin import membrane protein